MNSFSSFSYFENRVARDNTASENTVFLGQFPPNKQCKYTQPLPQIDSKVFSFDGTETELENQFHAFVSALVNENFGLKDFVCLLKEYPATMTASHIIHWYSSLYYKSATIENDVCVAILGSTLDESFSKKVFLRDISDPQAALDTFIFLEDSGTIYTILGTKRKSPSIRITFFDDRTLDVLETGLFGSVICGEHLEASEKTQMSSNFFQYMKNREETGREYFKLDSKNVSAAIRGTLEELAFVPPSNFTPYIVGKDVQPGRDKRYWVFGNHNEFGYKRPSESAMIAFVGHCTKPELKEPLDLYECSKGKVVELEYALKEFCVGGALDCAFPSHPRMFASVVKMLPDLFQ